MTEKLIRWFLFGVVIALLPIIFNSLRLFTHGGSLTFGQLVGRGELLLVTAGISAKAIGELIGSSTSMKIPKIIAGGVSLVILALASLYFADVAATYANNQTLDLSVISRMSLILFLTAVVSGGSCVALAEVK